MKIVIIAAAITLVTAAPLMAQGNGAGSAGGYITGLGGFATSASNTTGDLRLEAAVRIAPHVNVFGDFGRFANLQGDLQPSIDATASALAAGQGLVVSGGGKLPATYLTGGLRVDVPTHSRLMPYVLGGVGVAHLTPTTEFTLSSGTLPDGTTPDPGTDVTSALTLAGDVSALPSSSSFMFTLGGGVDIHVATHWLADAGYRYSQIEADAALSASPLRTNGMVFGFGYRF